eukprot:7695399-Alexandrium_andersonii.AAC.1
MQGKAASHERAQAWSREHALPHEAQQLASPSLSQIAASSICYPASEHRINGQSGDHEFERCGHVGTLTACPRSIAVRVFAVVAGSGV